MSNAFRNVASAIVAFVIAGPLHAEDFRLGPPPLAAPVGGAIEMLEAGPIFAEPYMCAEHPLGELAFAGDALGTDCLVTGGIDEETGFARAYRTDGSTNEDWFGWRAVVLAPVSGTVLGVYANRVVNTPGVMGRPPAGTIRIRTDEGIIVVIAHLGEFSVAGGEWVDRGMMIGVVGNNGVARAPHIHVGAYHEADTMPLQIRWNLREIADARQTGEPDAAF